MAIEAPTPNLNASAAAGGSTTGARIRPEYPACSSARTTALLSPEAPEEGDKVAARYQQEARWFQGDSAASSTGLSAVAPAAAPLDTTGEQRLPGMKPSVWPGPRMSVPELLEEMNDGRRYRLWLSLGAAATLVYTVVYLVVR